MNISHFYDYLATLHLNILAKSLFLIILGYIAGRTVSKNVSILFAKRLTPHQLVLLRLILFYVIFFLFLASAVQQLGFSIGAVLGATGILTIAITLASQTTLSNVISGFFILGEKTFQIGDTIKINDIQGEVLSINLFSLKIRTPDNTMIRIPNEMLVKSPIINVSYFPTRRLDVLFNISYKANLVELEEMLLNVAKKNKFAINNPPVFSILNFGDNALGVQLSMWTNKENYNEARNSLYYNIIKTLEEQGSQLLDTFYTRHAEPIEVNLLQK